MKISSVHNATLASLQTAAVSPNKAAATPVEPKPSEEMHKALSRIADKGFRDPQDIKRNVQEAVMQLNEQLAKSNNNTLAFAIDKSLSLPVVSVRNVETGELIRQIPNETIVKVAHHLERVKGILWDQAS